MTDELASDFNGGSFPAIIGLVWSGKSSCLAETPEQSGWWGGEVCVREVVSGGGRSGGCDHGCCFSFHVPIRL